MDTVGSPEKRRGTVQQDETIAAYNSHADAYAELTQPDKIDDPALVSLISRLPTGALVLDLGCGPGTASAELRKNGFRVDPVDASVAMVKLANETFAVDARLATFNEIDAQDEYHAIWANFSLLHAPKAKFSDYLKRLHVALKSNGLLHLGMKLGDGEQRDKLGRHYAYYHEEELKQFLSELGFDTIETGTGEAMGMAGDIEPWITILARK